MSTTSEYANVEQRCAQSCAYRNYDGSGFCEMGDMDKVMGMLSTGWNMLES
jgi:hypothetical protein